ncbi:Y+L amino acid transporter 2 [Sarcoptes scabiei]|uniref:Y+L amino acid transporter 2 n=1 Tax=Sarcoptes scabiei TaxID=52283 RepID=A0A834RGG7_SARSC|nr:Y+L amino acid transporter 2 [Sarcoptes scabiei]
MSTIKFKRQIDLKNGIFFVVTTIIGSGIFITPKGVFQYSGCSYATTILIWIFCGLYSMLGSLCYSELGTTILRSGGDYAYIKLGFGSTIAFVYLWINIIVIKPAAQAIISITFAKYLIGTFTVNAIENENCNRFDYSTDLSTRLIAIVTICLLSWINSRDVKWALGIQNAFTILKLLALGIIISSGIILFYFDEYWYKWIAPKIQASQQNLPKGGQIDLNATEICRPIYSLSIYSGLFAFGGWNFLNIITDELKNPYKNLPKAAIVGILISTIIYVLTNLSYFLILSTNEILSNDAIALTFGRKIIGSYGNSFVSFSIAISTLGSLNATIFTTSRLFCMQLKRNNYLRFSECFITNVSLRFFR